MNSNLSSESNLMNIPGILLLSVRNFLKDSLSDAENLSEYSRVNKSKAASIADTVTETCGGGGDAGARAAWDDVLADMLLQTCLNELLTSENIAERLLPPDPPLADARFFFWAVFLSFASIAGSSFI